MKNYCLAIVRHEIKKIPIFLKIKACFISAEKTPENSTV